MFSFLWHFYFGVEEDFYVQFGSSNNSEQIDFESSSLFISFGYVEQRGIFHGMSEDDNR